MNMEGQNLAVAILLVVPLGIRKDKDGKPIEELDMFVTPFRVWESLTEGISELMWSQSQEVALMN